MAMTVKLIRFLTGEEIIAEIFSEGSDRLVVKNPLRIIVIPSKVPSQNPNVGFAPFAEFSQDNIFEFNLGHILCTMNPIKEFLNQYNLSFGGIITPPSQGLILPT